LSAVKVELLKARTMRPEVALGQNAVTTLLVNAFAWQFNSPSFL